MKALLLTVCGPSGSGKTTVVEALRDTCEPYIETTAGNPHLSALLEGRSDFDAFANQRWFLSRMTEFLATADPQRPVILDQDPQAIIHVYTQMFRDAGLIDERSFATLLGELSKLELSAAQWKSPRTIFYLHAPPDVLRARVLRRAGASATASRDWFATVREYFDRVVAGLPNVVQIATADLGREEVISIVRSSVSALATEAAIQANSSGSAG